MQVSSFALNGYTPSVTDMDVIRQSVAKAIADMAQIAETLEGSRSAALCVAVADFIAARYVSKGEYPDRDAVKEFVTDAAGGKEGATSLHKTLDNNITLACKAARLAVERNRTGFYVAWQRHVPIDASNPKGAHKRELSDSATRPAGAGWTRVLMHQMSVWAPLEKAKKKGRNEPDTYNDRSPIHNRPSNDEINRAYAIMVQMKGHDGAGNLTAKKREEAVGAGQGATAETKVSIAELSGTAPAQAAKYLADALLSLLNDQGAREAISEDDATIGSLNDLLGALSYHCQPDEFVTGPMPADIKDAA